MEKKARAPANTSIRTLIMGQILENSRIIDKKLNLGTPTTVLSVISHW